MHTSDNREYYARMLILPYVERKVSWGEHIKDMDAKGLQRELRMVLEGIADSEEDKTSVQDSDFSKCAVLDC